MSSAPLTGWRVAAIDDSALMRTLITEILKGFGADVFATDDVEHAFAKVSNRLANVVICDWDMTPVSGLTFLNRVRASRIAAVSKIPFIMLTAHNGSEAVRTAMRAGASSYVVKPFAPATLLAHVLKLRQKDTDKGTWALT